MSKRNFVNVADKKNNINYFSKIERWINESKKYQDDINLKELSRLSNKEIKKKLNGAIKTDDGRYKIQSTSLTYDLWFYYDAPTKYYSDLFRLIRSLRGCIHDELYHPYISFTYPNDTKMYQMSMIHFTFNMIIWLPLFIMDIQITKDLTFMPKVFNNKSYIDFLNNKIIEPYKHLLTHNEMSKILAKMYDLFIIISERYSLDLGLSFSLNDLIKRWDNQEIYDLNHTKIPKNMQINETENYLNERVRRYSEIMLNEQDDNVLMPLLRSGQGANIKQLREFTISVGFKPDINGYTIPYAPSSNFITNGIRKPVDYSIDSTGGRKSSILALAIASSGYLARTYCKSSSDLYLCSDPDYDCGSVNYYEREITNKYDLEDMRGRWYLTKEGTLRQLIDTDYELIGQTLKFRSPTTCASKNGICATCYGYLYSQNLGINVGINSSLVLSEKSYQNTMSAKHALSTTTETLELSPEFYEYFRIENGYCIRIRDDIDMPENFNMMINIHEIQMDNDIQDLQDNEYIMGFKLYNKEEESYIIINEEKKHKLYIGNYLFKMVVSKRKTKDYSEDGWISISLDDFDPEEDLLYARLENDELTRPLNEIKRLIEKGSEIEEVNSPSDLINKLNKLMKSGGVYTESVHVEILCRNLIRDKNDKTKLPDYTKPNPDYVITSVHNSILNSNSVITSFTFERLHNQLSNPTTYKKNGTSPLDRLFMLE